MKIFYCLIALNLTLTGLYAADLTSEETPPSSPSFQSTEENSSDQEHETGPYVNETSLPVIDFSQIKPIDIGELKKDYAKTPEILYAPHRPHDATQEQQHNEHLILAELSETIITNNRVIEIVAQTPALRAALMGTLYGRQAGFKIRVVFDLSTMSKNSLPIEIRAVDGQFEIDETNKRRSAQLTFFSLNEATNAPTTPQESQALLLKQLNACALDLQGKIGKGAHKRALPEGEFDIPPAKKSKN